jgi:hypothetical protein
MTKPNSKIIRVKKYECFYCVRGGFSKRELIKHEKEKHLHTLESLTQEAIRRNI